MGNFRLALTFIFDGGTGSGFGMGIIRPKLSYDSYFGMWNLREGARDGEFDGAGEAG